MDPHHDTETIDDLSALAWVHDELKRTLEGAHKALRRYLKESDALSGSDVDAVDPGVLRTARSQVHQGVGALELVGLPTAAQVLRGSEAALAKLTATRPVKLSAAAVETLERASFALLDYLSRLLASKPVSPLAMFNQYRAVQELAGADRIHPADLWPHDWQWRDVPGDGSAARAPDAALRSEVEAQTLALMRSGGTAPALALSDLFAGLAAGTPAAERERVALWRMAAAFFEAQGQGLLAPDVYSKRIASRLLAQLRISEKPDAAARDVSERLAQDLLFFCAQSASPGDGSRAPRLAAVRQAWQLARRAPVDYNATLLGRHDPALIAQAKKRVAAAKDGWAAVAAGEVHRLTSLGEQFQLVGDSLRKLYPGGERLAQALAQTAQATVAAGAAPPAALAMEVATAVLYLEASLEDGDFDHPALAERVPRLAARIHQVREGAQPQPLDAWMEELYRRVSDRQTMGSVVAELKTALAESEKAIDKFFRNPEDRGLLVPVTPQLQSMRGVFSVLGLESASLAVLRMSEDVDALAAGAAGGDAARATERLASNLGALGFLIDMLNVQPAMAKSLFAFDAGRGLLRAVAAGGRHRASGFGAFDAEATLPVPVEPRLIEQAQSLAVAAAAPEVPIEQVRDELERLSQEALVADQPELAETMAQVKSAFEVAATDDERSAVRDELASAMTEFVHTASRPMPLDAIASRPLPLLSAAPTPAGQTGLEQDAEMREIFLEEAREVIDNARAALVALGTAADDLGEMTTVRRAFHTLKGSSRMVGLKAFGEAAWSCEQLYNALLAEQTPADAGLIALSNDVLAYLADWADAIAAGRDGGHVDADVRTAVEAWHQRGEDARLPLPGAKLLFRTDVAVSAPAPLLQTRDDDGPSMPSVSKPLPLLDVMPELPRASDLELVPAAVQPLDKMLAPAAPVDFEFDLGEAAALPTGGRDALQALAVPEREHGAPAPDAVSSMMALDIGPASVPAPLPQTEPEPEPFKTIGPLRVGIALFNIFINEADEQSRRLATELAEWRHELAQPVSDNAIALAHSLAGNSATVGFADLSHLARLLEHALMRSQAIADADADEAALFVDAADEIRRLLHQFAAGFLKSPPAALVDRLVDHERWAAERLEALTRQAAPVAPEAPVELPAAVDVAEVDPLDVPFAESGHMPRMPDLPAEPAFVPPLVAPVAPVQPAARVPVAPVAVPVAAPRAPARALFDTVDEDDDIDAVDAVDAELFPIFEEEALELLPQLASRVRDWAAQPGDPAGGTGCMRTLHTLKGGARLAGAMRLGEMAHRLETAVERLGARGDATAHEVEALFGRVDALGKAFERLQRGGGVAAEPAAEPVRAAPPQVAAVPVVPVVPVMPVVAVAPAMPLVPPVAAAPMVPTPAAALPAAAAPAAIDWQRFSGGDLAAERRSEDRLRGGAAGGTVRVRAPLLDRLVNHAGEVSITRSRIASEVGLLKGSLGDLNENLDRLRAQLRDIELQAESQISSRIEAAKSQGQNFDPLEMDRFTRFQELTRMMAESVADVATVQRSLTRALQATEDDLAAQERLTRDLQDDLLSTRMVEFESLSDRLYRVARQAAKELQKHVRLDIEGGSIEVDRGVLERMGGAFEHLLRNCVTHGIESPEVRAAAGKDGTGQITVAVGHEGNEVAVEFRDDGAGLNFARIRERAQALGLLAPGAAADEAELARFIFLPGFSTAESVNELAGRGIGMDVVKSEVDALGGRIETHSQPGRGTSFRLVLPLTTAVTQVVMLRAGAVSVAVPATLVEIVRRVPAAEVAAAYAQGRLDHDGAAVPFYWLGALLQAGGRSAETASRTLPVVVVRSAQQRIALHVDEVIGQQEVVVKNLGAQLARVPGLAGVTLLASGSPALIYNPVALATLYGDAAREAMNEAPAAPSAPLAPTAAVAAASESQAPLVLVVDDSITVRRVTQRLLAREGWRVALAKDGLDALEKLAEEVPAVVLSDIEMPRMDGFDLVRNLRNDPRLAALPVIMITSRIAQKHRDMAAELGVQHYLGKPYPEEELLALVARYAGAAVAAGAQ